MSRSTFFSIIGAALIVAVVLICTSCGQQAYVQASPPPVVAQVVPAPAVVLGPTVVIHHYSYPAYIAPRVTVVHQTTIIRRPVVAVRSYSVRSYSSRR